MSRHSFWFSLVAVVVLLVAFLLLGPSLMAAPRFDSQASPRALLKPLATPGSAMIPATLAQGLAPQSVAEAGSLISQDLIFPPVQDFGSWKVTQGYNTSGTHGNTVPNEKYAFDLVFRDDPSQTGGKLVISSVRGILRWWCEDTPEKKCGYAPGGGIYIQLDPEYTHPRTRPYLFAIYMHLDGPEFKKLESKKNQYIEVGEVLGRINSSAQHIHFNLFSSDKIGGGGRPDRDPEWCRTCPAAVLSPTPIARKDSWDPDGSTNQYSGWVIQRLGGANQPPQARFTISVPHLWTGNIWAYIGETVSFNGSTSSDPDGQVVRWDWDFGDGVSQGGGSSSTTHVYTTPGTYQVRVTVTDNAGARNTSEAQAVRILSRTQTQQNVDVALVIDCTSSMDWSDRDPAGLRKQAAKVFIQLARTGDKIAVIGFTTQSYIFAALTEIRSQADKDTLQQAVDQVFSNGDTDLGVGLQAGYDQLNSDTSAITRRAAVFLTDGEQDCGSGCDYHDQHLLYRNRGWRVYTVGLGSGQDAALLQRIASDTGGTYYNSPDSANLQAIYRDLSGQLTGETSLLHNVLNLNQGASQSVAQSIPGIPQLTASLLWSGTATGQAVTARRADGTFITIQANDARLYLVDPTGHQVDPNDPTIEHQKGTTFELYRLRDPQPGTWTFRVQVLSASGTIPLTLDATTVDVVPPIGQIVNYNPYVNSRSIQLSFDVSDPGHPTAADIEFRLSNDGTTWSNWQPLTGAAPWTLPDSNDVIYVYAQFRDAAGNTSSGDIANFFLDTQPPETTITSGPSGPVSTPNVTFTWEGTDNAGEGDADYDYSWKLEGYDADWSPFTSGVQTKTYSGLPVGAYTFRVRTRDFAGNVDLTPAERSFTVPPTVGQIIFSSSRGGNPSDIYVMNEDGSDIRRLTNDPANDGQAEVSPEGTKIVFASNRSGSNQVYVMDSSGGNVRQLTTTGQSNSWPRWSPDGTQVLYNCDNKICVMKADGTNQRQLTSGYDGWGLGWSPDGQRIVFTHWDSVTDWDLWVMNADGSNKALLFRMDGRVPEVAPDWSLDGTRLVFEVLGTWSSIYSVNLDGTGLVQLSGSSDARRPVWSIDGRRILFWSNRDGNNEIYVMNADGSGLRRLTNDPSSDTDASWVRVPIVGRIMFASSRGSNPQDLYVMNEDGSNVRQLTNDSRVSGLPIVSHSGNKVAFARLVNGLGQVFGMNIDGSNVRQLTNCPGPISCNPLEWSLDDSKILWACGFDICTMNPDGTAQTIILSGNKCCAHWSPDNRRLVYSWWLGSDGDWEVFVANADGSNPVRLTQNPNVDWASFWSPDGSKILFVSNRDGNPEVYVMNADGSNQTNLSRNLADDAAPSWLSDGQHIIFHSNRDGNYEIYTMNADGTNPRNLTTNSAKDVEPFWFAISGSTNSISGRVTDDASTAVAGATVSATGPTSASATTGSDGTYTLSNLPAGTYSVSASKIGYTSPASRNVTVPPNATNVDFVLQRQAQNVGIAISPSSKSATVGEIFTLDIKISAGSQPVDSVDSYLSFDRNYLRVVDASGNETNSITPGTTLPVVLQNSADNSQGRIIYSAGKQLGGVSPSGDFVLATIRFKAIAAIGGGGTNVSFLSGTGVFYQGNSLPIFTSNGNVQIQEAISLKGRVTLQGRGSPPSDRWSNFPLALTLYSPGGTSPVGNYTANTDTSGYFTVTGITQGTYDAKVKNAHTLSNKKTNVGVPTGPTAVDFGTLLEGDANNDDNVGGADYSILATAYGKCSGQSGWDSRADFNGSGCIEGADYSLLASNYGRHGPIALAITVMGPVETNVISGSVVISIDPSSKNVAPGAVFTLDIKIAAGSQPVDSVDSYLSFDRNYLRVVDASGNETNSIEPGSTLPVMLQNSADNSQGRITYSAGKQLGGVSPSGDFVLATIRFKAIAASPGGGTAITFQSGTDAFYQGDSVLGTLVNGAVSAGYRVYLPILLWQYNSW